MVMPALALTEADFNRVMDLAGLYRDGQGWLEIEIVSSLVTSLNYVDDQGMYDARFDKQLAVESIYRALGRGVDEPRKTALHRIVTRLANAPSQPGASTTNTVVDAFAREEIRTLDTDLTSETRRRAEADQALGRRIDGEITAREDADDVLGRAIDRKQDQLSSDQLAVVNAEPFTSGDETKLDGLADIKSIGARLTLSSAGELSADEQGGGSGDVTTAQFNAAIAAQNSARAALATRSDQGDDLQIVEVNTAAHYTQTLAAQKTSANPLRIIIGADFTVTVSGRQIAHQFGQVLEFAPRSDSPENFATIPLEWVDNLKHLSTTASSEAEFTAAVNSNATKWTHLWIRCTARFFATIDGDRRARQIGELYHVPPHDVSPPQFIVDTTSNAEAIAIINDAIANGVALWARGPGQNVNAQNERVYPKASDLGPGQDNDFVLFTTGTGIISWKALPAAPGGGGGAGAGVFKEEFTMTVDPPNRGRNWNVSLGSFTLEDLQDHESVQLIVRASGGAVRTSSVNVSLSLVANSIVIDDTDGEIHGTGPSLANSNFAQSDDALMWYTHEGSGTSQTIYVLVRSTGTNDGPYEFTVTSIRQGAGGGGKAELTQAQQIGLLQSSPRPGNVIAESGKASEAIDVQYNIRIANAELLTGDIWVQGTVQGQPALARTKWSSAVALNLNIPDANVASVVASVQLSNTIELVLQFYDAASGGNLVEQLWWNIPFTELPAIPPGPKAPNVLQAPVNGQNGAGVGSITLPANYTDWRELFVADWEAAGNAQRARIATIPTALLAAQTSSTFDIREGGGQMLWTVATRVLAVNTSGGRNNDRIIHAVLQD